MMKITNGKIPVPCVAITLFVIFTAGVVYFGKDAIHPFVTKIDLASNAKLRNETLEIKRVEEFVTTLSFVRARFLMAFGIMEEDIRTERCKDLAESLKNAENAFVTGGSGKYYGVEYSVSGSANLDVTKWIVDGKIVKGDATKAILMEHERQRARYTNVLVCDAVHFEQFCTKYEERNLKFLAKTTFDSKFVTQIAAPIVCINNITASWGWDVCPFRHFSANEEWARKIYEKAEETVRENFGANFEISCRLNLNTVFGSRWETLESDMVLRAQNNNRGNLRGEICSIMKTDSDVERV